MINRWIRSSHYLKVNYEYSELESEFGAVCSDSVCSVYLGDQTPTETQTKPTFLPPVLGNWLWSQPVLLASQPTSSFLPFYHRVEKSYLFIYLFIYYLFFHLFIRFFHISIFLYFYNFFIYSFICFILVYLSTHSFLHQCFYVHLYKREKKAKHNLCFTIYL